MTERGRTPTRPFVLICVSDPTAAARVQSAVESLDGAAHVISPLRLPQLFEGPPPCDALIYDLAPWDDNIPALVARIREVHPPLPILLYPPPHPRVSTLLLRCGEVAGVRVRMQSHESHEVEALHGLVRWLHASIYAERVLHLVQLLLPGLPPRARQYIRIILGRLTGTRGGRTLSVGSVVAETGTPIRTLQRALEDGGLPPPKALLDWITLMFAALWADATGRPTARVGRDFGVDPHRIYRLRRRLLPAAVRERITGPAQEFDLTFLAFAERCRIPSRTAFELLHRSA